MRNAKKTLSLLLALVMMLSLLPGRSATAYAATTYSAADLVDNNRVGLLIKTGDIIKVYDPVYYEADVSYFMGECFTIAGSTNDVNDSTTEWTADKDYIIVTTDDDIYVDWGGEAANVYWYYINLAPFVAVTGVTLQQGGDPVSQLELTVGGDDATLTAVVEPGGATNQTVTWTTSNANVATVNNGVVSAIGAGSATIKATATNGTSDATDDVFATVTVNVPAVPVTGVTLQQGGDPAGVLALHVGDTATLTAVVEPGEATNQTVTWTSGDEDVATVDENGVVSAVGEGSAIITATATNGTSDEDDDVVASVLVNVSAPAPAVTYYYRNANGAATQITDSVNVVTSDTTFDSSGWYVVTTNTNISNAIDVGGTVNLVLCDGATLTITSNDWEATIDVSNNGALNIYAGSTSDTITGSGSLFAIHTDGSDGIYNSGAVTVYGGTVKANGSTGISNNGSFTVKNGVVTADVVDGGFQNVMAGISGSGSFVVDGGTVNAGGFQFGVGVYDGSFTVNGGTVNAISPQSGIFLAGSMTVNGGTVIAKTSGDGDAIYKDSDGSPTITIGDSMYAYGGDDESTKAPIETDNVDKYKYVEFNSAAPAPASYTVTLSGGENATVTGGETTQTVSGAMTEVVFTAGEGRYFPTEDDAYGTHSGVTVTRSAYNIITVNGTPTADVAITLPTAYKGPTGSFDGEWVIEGAVWIIVSEDAFDDSNISCNSFEEAISKLPDEYLFIEIDEEAWEYEMHPDEELVISYGGGQLTLTAPEGYKVEQEQDTTNFDAADCVYICRCVEDTEQGGNGSVEEITIVAGAWPASEGNFTLFVGGRDAVNGSNYKTPNGETYPSYFNYVELTAGGEAEALTFLYDNELDYGVFSDYSELVSYRFVINNLYPDETQGIVRIDLNDGAPTITPLKAGTVYISFGAVLEEGDIPCWTHTAVQVVEPEVHEHSYGEPSWIWKRINGAWNAVAVFNCEANDDTQTVRATITSEESEGVVTYTAKASFRGFEYTCGDQMKDERSYTVTFGGSEVGDWYKWGDLCTLSFTVTDPEHQTSNRAWFINNKMVADGRNSYTFAVTEDSDVTTDNTTKNLPQAVISPTIKTTENRKAVYNVKWSLPTGSEVVSAMIYRGAKSTAEFVDPDLLISKGVKIDTGLYVRNGDFTLTISNLTPTKYQNVVTVITYRVNGEVTTLTAPVAHVMANGESMGEIDVTE